ncbi:MAG: hypothetical protein U1F60_13155 [Planctomycetota bacterium]
MVVPRDGRARPPMRPSLLDGMGFLPSWVRVAVGASMLAGGVVGALLGIGLWSVVVLLLGLGIGGPLLLGGLGDGRRARAAARERVLAEAQLEELRAAVAAAVAARRSVGAMLRSRGFHDSGVQRWIARECGVVLPNGER